MLELSKKLLIIVLTKKNSNITSWDIIHFLIYSNSKMFSVFFLLKIYRFTIAYIYSLLNKI